MKIAFLIDSYTGPFAGTERQISLLTREFQAAGHEVQLAVFRHTDYTRRGEFPAPVECLDIGRVASPLSWWRVYQWGRRARRDGVDVVQIFFNDASLFAPFCLAKADLPALVSRRDMGFWYSPLRLAMLRRMQAYAAGLVANSAAVASHCGAAEGFPEHRRTVIPNAVEVVPVEDRLASSGDELVVAIVANIRPIKRIEDAVRALALADGVRLRLVGGGDPAALSALAEALGVTARLDLVGVSEDVHAELRYVDVGLMCSTSEGLSNAIMEYMQAGLPVVATATGGNVELVTDGDNGMLYDVGDIEALAERLRRLAADPALRMQMGQRGRTIIGERFSLPHIAARYLELYQATTGSQQGGDYTNQREGLNGNRT